MKRVFLELPYGKPDPEMNPEQSWLVQVYRMTDEASQATVARLLASTGACTVDVRSCERGDFVIVECDPVSELSVYEFVEMSDFGAELIHSTKPAQEPAVPPQRTHLTA